MPGETCLSRIASTATTELKKSAYTFEWRISNFDIICPKECKDFASMDSPCFRAGDDIGKESTWYVSISGISKHIECYLHLKSVGPEGQMIKRCESVTCRFTISIVTNDSRIIEIDKTNFRELYSENISWGYPEYPKLIPIEELYEEEYLWPNNTLHISVQMEIYGDTVSYEAPVTFGRGTSMLETFSADFSGLLADTMYSDVKIRCGEKSFFVHKLILSARSKVFRVMFEAKMLEAKSYEVDIPDLDPATVRLILTYIYTGKVLVPDDSSSWTEMIHGAEKYDLQDMKNYCFDKMVECVTNETIGAVAVVAYAYNADRSTQDVIKNYCQNNIVTLMKDANFKQLVKTHPDAFF